MRALLCLMVTFTVGCEPLPSNVVEVRVLGTVYIEGIQPDMQRPAIELPDTVSAATPFTVSVITEVGGCLRGGEADETEVEVNGNSAVITPYDYSTSSLDGGSSHICTDDLRFAGHMAQVTFGAPGEGTVVVRSRTSDLDATPIEYEYAVWVE